MKAILISINPKGVEKIASGEKTIEVRKSKPKLKTPFKCFIYATKPKKWFRYSSFGYASNESLWLSNGKVKMSDGFEFWADGKKDYDCLNGKVIGEFVCDRIDSYVGKDDDDREYWDLSVIEWEDLKEKSCLTIKQIVDYTGDSHNCYGWHITDLKIYDKPKDLSEFRTICRDAYCQDDYGIPTWFCKDGYGSCAVKDKEKEFPYDDECIYFDCPCYGENCEHEDYAYCLCNGLKPITRPPQSWCYLED